MIGAMDIYHLTLLRGDVLRGATFMRGATLMERATLYFSG